MKVKKADSAGGQAWACLSAEFRRRCTEGRLKDIEGDREANGWYAILCYMLYHAMIYYGMLWYTIPCYQILYYHMLYYAMCYQMHNVDSMIHDLQDMTSRQHLTWRPWSLGVGWLEEQPWDARWRHEADVFSEQEQCTDREWLNAMKRKWSESNWK